MAFFKTGDAIPVVRYYSNDGKSVICDSCGKDLTVVAMDDTDAGNSLICDACDLADEGIGEPE